MSSSRRFSYAFRRFSRLAHFSAVASVIGVVSVAHGQSLSSLSDPVPAAVGKSTVTGTLDPNTQLHIAVSLVSPNLAALKSFVDSVSDPKSPNYRQFLTPAQVGQRFGQPTANVDAVVNYLKSQGFTIKLVGSNNLTILADGTAAQASKAFHTSFSTFVSHDPNDPENKNYFSYTSPLQIPAEIASIVESVTGLQNHTKGIPRLKKSARKLKSGQYTLTPSQASVLYDVAPMHTANFYGQNRHIAISNFDGFRLSNVPLFYSAFSLVTPPGGVLSNVNVVTLNGGSGSGTPAGEGDLDIQMVLGQAPLCTLTIYDGTDLIGVLAQEANDNLADAVTESYGWDYDAAQASSAHTIHLQMSAQGQTYMLASGDYGTSLQPYSYGDYDPDVLNVGGTVPTFTSTGKRISEVAWANSGDGVGSGGGWVTSPSVSFNALPAYQKGNGVPTTIPYRLVPDVALAAAGTNSGFQGAFFDYFNGALSEEEGTSCAAPAFTGMLACTEQDLINKGYLLANSSGKYRMGRLNDLIYSQNGRSDIWFDILSGTTGSLPNGQLASAHAGWDFTSGWGAPDFNALVSALTSTPPVNLIPAFSVYQGQGTKLSGSGASLASVDGNYLSETSVSSSAGPVAATSFTYTLTQKLSSIAGLQFNFADLAPQGSTTFIYLLNANSGNYDLVSDVAMNGSVVQTTIGSINLTNYVNSTNQVGVVVRTVFPSRLQVPSFVHKIDQATLTESFK